MPFRATGPPSSDPEDAAHPGWRRAKPAGRCHYSCKDCALDEKSRVRGYVVASLSGAGAMVLNLLSLGLMQSLVTRCRVCRHRMHRHRMRRGRFASAADTVQFPSVPG